ncbi:tetratricopeptide repeat protein [Maribacter sp. IgM3_T14_3]|uniref:tetratricopeptide repeat protein n=1 Tax=Maribacter sp. IgM3_T14_3 TaxID=3415140 RepID=UPI003C6F8FB9
MDKEQLLQQYFANQLTKEQEGLFNELLLSDAEFKAQFDFENDLKRVIKEHEHQQLKAKLVGFEKGFAKEVETRMPKGGFKNWSIAASIALLMGLGWFGYNSLTGTDYQDLYNNNFEAYPNTVYNLTRGDTNETLEREAFAAYESGNFQKALDNFDKIAVIDQKPYFDFYKAQSYLKLGDTSSAVTLLKKIVGSGAEFEAEAQWYLALSYLKAKEEENAKSALQKLIANYSYNKEKAIELLKELD